MARHFCNLSQCGDTTVKIGVQHLSVNTKKMSLHDVFKLSNFYLLSLEMTAYLILR